jgi:hypothetical protein
LIPFHLLQFASRHPLVRLSSDAAAIQCGCAVVHLKAVADKHLLLPVLPSSVLPSPAASAYSPTDRAVGHLTHSIFESVR